MKLQIDTENKIIKIEEKVNLTELWDLLNKMFPDQGWREFSLETNTIITEWKEPIIIKYPLYPNLQIYPWIILPSMPSVIPIDPQPYFGDPLPGYVSYNTCDDNVGINEMDNTISKINSIKIPIKTKNTSIYNVEIVN